MTDKMQAVESLLRVASRLIIALERETGLLRDMQMGAVADMQAEKRQLVDAYEMQVRDLLAQPDLMRDVAPVLRAEFAAVAGRFEAAMTDNRRALTAATEAQQRLFKAIVEAAKQHRSSYRVYSADGMLPPPPAARQARGEPLSISLNRQL